jgi:hypothetical protein
VKYAPLILSIVGLLIFGLFALIACVSLLLLATSNGKVSGDEAGPFIGLGCCCSLPGLAMAIGGLIWFLIAKQRKDTTGG